MVLPIADDENALESELNTFVANPENSKLFDIEKSKEEMRSHDENVSHLATDKVPETKTSKALVDTTNKTLKRKYKTKKVVKAEKAKTSNKENAPEEKKQMKTGKTKVSSYSICDICALTKPLDFVSPLT